ncbi:hypothetical protein STEG23_000286 [Scotinomys teguina]
MRKCPFHNGSSLRGTAEDYVSHKSVRRPRPWGTRAGDLRVSGVSSPEQVRNEGNKKFLRCDSGSQTVFKIRDSLQEMFECESSL